MTEYCVSERLVIDQKIEFRQAMKSFLKSLKDAKKSNESKRRREVNCCLSDFYSLAHHFVVDGKFLTFAIHDSIITTFEKEIVPLLNCGKYLRPDLWIQMSWVCWCCVTFDEDGGNPTNGAGVDHNTIMNNNNDARQRPSTPLSLGKNSDRR